MLEENMLKVNLVVRLLDEEGRTASGYALKRELRLPFLPYAGMKLVMNRPLWQTKDHGELMPLVEEVIYNMDEQEIICLFTIHYPLTSSVWQAIEPNSLEWQYL